MATLSFKERKRRLDSLLEQYFQAALNLKYYSKTFSPDQLAGIVKFLNDTTPRLKIIQQKQPDLSDEIQRVFDAINAIFNPAPAKPRT